MNKRFPKTNVARRSKRGMALLMVLAVMALLMGLVLAIFSSAGTEFKSARYFSNQMQTGQLADAAIQTVISTIRSGTSNSTEVAWASQPGMIRTYGTNTGAASSTPLAYYKLYSSDRMVVSAAAAANFDPGTDVDGKWDAKPALFTDLNAPALGSEGKWRFPIIDPRIQISPNTASVDGFSYSDQATLANGATTTINKTVTSGGDRQRLPMPVKWIYVLKDGTLTVPTGVDGTGTIANWAGMPADQVPSKDNPITGRIAFWTDDESCKVNINTASEGVYWDVPRIMSLEDYGKNQFTTGTIPGLAISQPVQREFQRYSGHPGTTSLSAIFGNANWSPQLLTVPSPYPANPSSFDAQTLDPYYNLTPRVGLSSHIGGGGGGSKGGSYMSSNTSPVMNTDTDRLYTNVDELLFSPSISSGIRIPNTSNDTKPKIITQDVLEKTRFFLSASSSAPETTIFNTPRISMWPVWHNANKRTAHEHLLTFCATINGKTYGFTRSNPRSGTVDYNLTGSSGAKRNQELYAYLQSLTARNIPGFGGSLQDKYPSGPNGVSERDQILTYLYDYIRCTNLQDKSAGATPFTPLFVVTNKGETPGAGEVLPIKIGQTQGFGRFASVSSAGLLFYGTGKDTTGKVNKMRAMFLLMPTSPHQGVACVRGNVKYKVTKGLDTLQANGISLNFRPGGTTYTDANEIDTFGGRGMGGTDTPYVLMVWTDPTGAKGTIVKSFDDADAGGDAHYKYPFFSASDVTVDGTKTSFSFNGGLVEVEVRSSDTDELVQTLQFNFPTGNFRVPSYRADTVDPTTYYQPARRNPGNGSVILGEDTVVALEVGGHDHVANANPGRAADATAGDIRMIAGLANVPANRYRAHNNYTDAAIQGAHHMMSGNGSGMSRSTFGNLARGIAGSYPSSKADVPSRVPIGLSGGVSRKDGGPGDWDSGWGDQKDGAYINKPDEADTQLNTFMPYATGYKRGAESGSNTYFSPNRMIPSPLMFGSIPTGVQRNLPWQTLLFHPRPEDSSHPGFGTPKTPSPGISYTEPPDHLIADLFWMPVVEPYAISQPFSTSGKINLNYQMVPFTHIKRATGIHALMKSTKFAAVPVADVAVYKNTIGFTSGNPAYIPNRRRTVDIPKTLVAFEERFKNNELFRSASQICEIDLVPPEVSPASPTIAATKTAMATFWNSNQLTGDNLREKPYADLYSRLTTKSNAYTVHYRVQVLKKSRTSGADVWDESKDQVLSEHRGSTLIERHVDMTDPALPDFAEPGAPSLDAFYQFRVVHTKRFSF